MSEHREIACILCWSVEAAKVKPEEATPEYIATYMLAEAMKFPDTVVQRFEDLCPFHARKVHEKTPELRVRTP